MQRSWRFLLAAALLIVAAGGAVAFVPALATLSAPGLVPDAQGGLVASLGRNSASWTRQDLLASPEGRLKANRAVVVPHSCSADSKTSTWLLMLAKRADGLRRAFPSRASPSAPLLDRYLQGLVGRPVGTVSWDPLAPDDVFRLTGISGFLFVCVSSSALVADRQIDDIAAEILRISREQARRGTIVQVGIPRMPVTVAGQTAADNGGAQEFWGVALRDSLDGLEPDLRLDVLFGLYSLTPRGNVETFLPMAATAVTGMHRSGGGLRTAILMAAACFAGASLSAWYRRRAFRPAYVAGMLCFSFAGMGAVAALVPLDGFGGVLVAGWQDSFLRLAAGFAIGLFAESLTRFDWRRSFTE
ncbi:MAG: hypothetical protein QOJ94_2176 [Sphingomonadales bacterium]|jgi:hypothetical protein|nr:hypothetical protein [Sphingomonadales bacterium]